MKDGRVGFPRRFKRGRSFGPRENELLHVVNMYNIHIYICIYYIYTNIKNQIVGKLPFFSSNGKCVGPALFWMAILNGLKTKQQEGMSKKLGDSRFTRLP